MAGIYTLSMFECVILLPKRSTNLRIKIKLNEKRSIQVEGIMARMGGVGWRKKITFKINKIK